MAVSTTEAELIAASEATKELVWLKRLLQEITTVRSTKLLMDNMSAMKLVKNPIFHKRSKHIDVRYFFVREKYEEGILQPVHVSSENQAADVLTKALGRIQMKRLCDVNRLCDLCK